MLRRGGEGRGGRSGGRYGVRRVERLVGVGG